MDKVHFGVMMIANLEIGYLTPPVGLNLFVAMAAFKEPFSLIVRAVVPFIIIIMLFWLVIVAAWPGLTLFFVTEPPGTGWCGGMSALHCPVRTGVLTMSDLGGDLERLAAAAARADAHHEFIPRITWPDGVRMAVNVTLDFDAMLLRRLMNETPSQLAKGEFGGRVGIWRMIELFDSLGIKGTVFTPGRIVELYPEALRHVHAQGHEIADHMWEHHVPKDAALERDHLRKAAAAIRSITGRHPVGTRSWHSQALLQDEGFIYNSHGHAHHLPHYHRDPGTGKALLNLPFHYVIDDAMFYSFAWLGSGNAAQRISDPDRVCDMWWDAFWQQYQQGGYLNVVMHPFVSGRALRVAMMDRLLRRMQSLPGVWFPTSEELARHVLAAHPAKEG